MLLDDLVGVIELLKERIATHGPALRENETRTRMALIDPLLQALGWDVSDPAMVTPEYSVGASRADYALLTSTGTPSALIEAKKLDESLVSHRMQMLNYANASGIPYAGLTDGNHWEMYTVFDLAPIEQRRILDVAIATTAPHEAALKLLLLWRPNLESGQPVAAKGPVLNAANNSTDEIFTSEAVAADIETPHSQHPTSGVNDGWTPLGEIPREAKGIIPMAIRFPNGEENQTVSLIEVLVKMSEYLIRDGRITDENCPIRFPKSKYIIHTSPEYADGSAFERPERLSNGLYLDKRIKRPLQKCKDLLTRYSGESLASVYLKVG